MSEVQKLKPTQPLGCLSRSGRRGVITSETQSEGNVEKEFEGERLKIKNILQIVPNESHCKSVTVLMYHESGRK